MEITESGCYHIEALGAAGGIAENKYDGGVGAKVTTREIISKGTTLNVVVGHHGGDAVRNRPQVVTYSRCMSVLTSIT